VCCVDSYQFYPSRFIGSCYVTVCMRYADERVLQEFQLFQLYLAHITATIPLAPERLCLLHMQTMRHNPDINDRDCAAASYFE
jgi:hypothetical protein